MTPAAAGVFYPIGLTIDPVIGSAAMSGSSIMVVLFSNLMRVINFDPLK